MAPFKCPKEAFPMEALIQNPDNNCQLNFKSKKKEGFLINSTGSPHLSHIYPHSYEHMAQPQTPEPCMNFHSKSLKWWSE